MPRNYFKSYVWLIDTLQHYGPLTLKRLQELWLNSTVNESHKPLASRTMSNHITAIGDVFGIDIECDRRTNKYYIDNEDDVGSNNIRKWLLDALALNNLLNEKASLKNRVLCEDRPSGYRFLDTIIRAMHENRTLAVTYMGYTMSISRDFTLKPYFLREYKKRWYLYAGREDAEELHMYALDRMTDVTCGDSKFVMPSDFNVYDYFHGIYGPRVYDSMQMETVRVKANASQSNYLRSLPLHYSQKEIETHDDYSIFEYCIAVDYDFIHDILSFGDSVEILSPESIRETFISISDRLYHMYCK